MKIKIDVFKKDVFGFLKNCIYCLTLSIKSSLLYTSIRIITKIFSSISSIIVVFLLAKILNILASPLKGEQINRMVLIAVGMFAILIISRILTIISDYCTSMHNDILNNYINIKVMEKNFSIDIEYFDNPNFYDFLETCKRDSSSLVSVIWNLINCISTLITLLSALFIILKVSIFGGVIMILATIPSAVINQIYTKELYFWNLGNIKEQRKLSYLSYLSTDKNVAMDIRLFDIGDFLKKRYTDIWNIYHIFRKNKTKKKTFYMVILSTLPEICIGIEVIYVITDIANGIRNIGDFTLYYGLLGQLSISLIFFIDALIRIYEDRLKIENYKKFENIENNMKNKGIKLIEGGVKIEFKNVSFCYPNTEKNILRNISFKIEKNEKVCLVGVNGAGKSTLIKLLLRFYDPNEGEILINEINIKEYEINNFRTIFSSFFQNVNTYSFNLRENIVISNLEKSLKNEESQIYESLEKSNSLELLNMLPSGLNQYITKLFDEDGIELSGGQKQKLALARTFYRECKVMVLDEPSAALDPESEYELFESLKKLCDNKTTLFTSHRLSNVHLADKIILLEEGKIIEQGTHDHLMEFGKRYATLFKYQAEKYNL